MISRIFDISYKALGQKFSAARGLSLGALIALGACTGGGSSGGDSSDAIAPVPSPENFDYFSMFINLVDVVILPNYETLSASASNLSDANGPLANYCAAIGSSEETTALGDARAAWLAAMSDFQLTEAHQIGPILKDAGALRSRLITPEDSNFSTCGIDQSTLLSRKPDFGIETRLANQKGLSALEYLLFNEQLDHTCPAQIPETQNWNERTEQQRRLFRCEHAMLLAQDIASAATAVERAWQVDGDNYRAEFAYPDNAEAIISLLSEALFYVEISLKDVKLGPVIGLHNRCSRVACPDNVESPYSQTSLHNIADNLQSFRDLFTGREGLSFDDIIRSEGVAEVSQRIVQQVDDALALLDAAPASLSAQAQSQLALNDDTACINSAANPDADQTAHACALHGLVKRITDSMRTDFITVVNLDLPERAQSDND